MRRRIIDRDPAHTVSMWHLDGGAYVASLPAPRPFEWVLNGTPGDHVN